MSKKIILSFVIVISIPVVSLTLSSYKSVQTKKIVPIITKKKLLKFGKQHLDYILEQKFAIPQFALIGD